MKIILKIKKLNDEIKFEEIKIVDNSHLHKGHKFFLQKNYIYDLKLNQFTCNQ